MRLSNKDDEVQCKMCGLSSKGDEVQCKMYGGRAYGLSSKDDEEQRIGRIGPLSPCAQPEPQKRRFINTYQSWNKTL